MTNWLVFAVLAILLLPCYFGCSAESDDTVPPARLSGTVGGCQILKANDKIRIAAMAQTTGGEWLEFAGAPVKLPDPGAGSDTMATFAITLNGEPPESLKWVTEGNGVTRRVELQIMSYEDVDGNGAFSDGDSFTGAAGDVVHYFTTDYPDSGAALGFNLLPDLESSYTQDFDAFNVFVPAGQCDGPSEDGDQAIEDGDEAEAATDGDEDAASDGDEEAGEV